ncbi:bestrophin family protein [Ostreibacterium oceani]|uniref:Bestrophin n=1 Tax=Ostreibacterium oceani TaxID=2654998 RepID=A0A6N7EVG2_9GAMM|nr:bestrophin family ion channel [Ostreibacterium oceani]MPV85419.1 hypothetical protein [Ostreibacterium oceani]
MIIRHYPSVWKLFFIRHGSIVPLIKWRLFAIFCLALGVTFIQYIHPSIFSAINLSYFTMIGLALSLFLGFRNNTAYERWWEGRNLWGQLIKETRSIARTTRSVMDNHVDADMIARIDRYLICYPICLRHQCQGTKMDSEVIDRLLADEHAQILGKVNPANALLLMLSREIGQHYQQGKISDIIYQTLDSRIDAINLIQAGCERLNKTPVPFAYNLLLQRTAMLYCLLLPFGLVSHTVWATAPLTLLITYTFFGLDALARDLEDPFSTCPNSLPLQALCINIERIIMDMQGKSKQAMPPLPKIKNYILK